jgi:hypothetical protein
MATKYNKPGELSTPESADELTPRPPEVVAKINEELGELFKQLEEDRPLVSVKKDLKKWFVGITPDALRSVTIGGQSFPIFTSKLESSWANTKETTEVPRRGSVILLSGKQVEFIRAKMAKLAIRFTGATSMTFRLPEGDEKYFYQEATEFPIAMFCYMWLVEDLQKASDDWRNGMDIPTVMKRSSFLLEKLGTGWRDPKGQPIPLILPQEKVVLV